MKRLADPTLWAGILAPLLALLVLGVYPRPLAVDRSLQAARENEAAGKPGQAQAAIELAARQMPWWADLWVEAGRLAYSAGDDPGAQSDFKNALAAGPLPVERWVEYGEAAQRGGDEAGARSIWREAIERTGAEDPFFERIISADRTLGDEQGFIVDLKSHLTRNPVDGKAAFLLAQVLSISQPADAIGWARQAEASGGATSGQVKRLEAGIGLQTAETDLAMRYLTAGRTLGSLETWDLAAWAFQHAIDTDAQNAEARAFLGEARQHLGQDGWPELSKAVEIRPDSLLVQALQALYWQRQGKPERALVHLHAAAEAEPDNPIWQVELGNALAGMGNQTEALDYYLKAVQIDPSNAAYWKTLAAFSIKTNYQLDEIGLNAARQAVALTPDDAEALDIMGQIFYGLGDATSAERFFGRAAVAQPDNATIQLHLGNLYLMTGETGKARDALSLASKLQPDEGAGLQAERLLETFFPP